MILDSLPFIVMIQKSLLIKSLLLSTSISQADVAGYNVDKVNDALIISDIKLSEMDTFNLIFYIDNDLAETNGPTKHLVLSTKESKYYNEVEKYFDLTPDILLSHKISKKLGKMNRYLGSFMIFDDPSIPPAIVSMVKNDQYGYSFFFNFYKNFEEEIRKREEVEKLKREWYNSNH